VGFRPLHESANYVTSVARFGKNEKSCGKWGEWAGLLWSQSCPRLLVMIPRLTPCILFTLAITLSIGAAEHPALSGTWQLDLAASHFGSMPPPGSAVLTISSGPHKIIHVTVAMNVSHQERTEESEWRVDDHYHPVEGSGGGEVLAKWESGVLIGKRLTERGMEETRFRLAPGGESLTESIESGGNVTTLIWRRQ
jgi:hypothetical protein